MTLNDTGDNDDGPNGLQNFPVLAGATSDSGGTSVQGALNSKSSTAFTLQFFATPACDPSGYGEGDNFIGSTTVRTDSTGDAGFAVSFAKVAPRGQFITSTAADANGNTSEFSACREVGEPVDSDGDGVNYPPDNCPSVANASQGDSDVDYVGDACDNCPLVTNSGQQNTDGDSAGNVCDSDDDNDGVTDAGDNCPVDANPGQENADGDSLGNVCDTDDDGDGRVDGSDNCPLNANDNQANADGDSSGNVCDTEGPSPNTSGLGGGDDCADGLDNDGDTLADGADPACPPASTPAGAVAAGGYHTCATTGARGLKCWGYNYYGQLGDGTIGSGCYCRTTPVNVVGFAEAPADSDGDGDPDVNDNCPDTANAGQENADGDASGDACDPCTNDPGDDADSDGWCGGSGFMPPKTGDNDDCPNTANPGQEDADGDSVGDACDPCTNDAPDDADGDGVCGGSGFLAPKSGDNDNCPDWANPTQAMPPWSVPANDLDCDGFNGSVENFVATSSTAHCPATATADDEVDAWPPDFNDNTQVNLQDVLLLKPHFNAAPPNPSYDQRFDLSANGEIKLQDVLLMKPYFGLLCT